MSKKNDKKSKNRTTSKSKRYLGGKENILSDEPSLASNLEKTASIGIQAANYQVANALDVVADTLNVDPNASADMVLEKVNKQVENINKAFQSPEGKQILTELGELARQVIKTTEEPLKEGQRVFNQMLREQMESFEKLIWGAIGLIPVIGDMTEIIRIANDLFESFIKTMKAASIISVETSQALEDIKRTINEKANLFTRMADLMQTTLTQGLSEGLSKGINEGNRRINAALESVNEGLTEGINEGNRRINAALEGVSSNLEEQTKNLIKEKKLSLSKIRKGGARMTKRTHKSIENFLSSKITASHMKQKYSLKRRTRKHK